MASSGKVEIKIMDSSRNILKKTSGKWFWHPESAKRIDAGNREPPLWVIVEINDTQEIYEQKTTGNTLMIVDQINR